MYAIQTPETLFEGKNASVKLSEENFGDRDKPVVGMVWYCGCVRGMVSLKKRRFQVSGHDLDLSYITDRIIAMGYPSIGLEALYRNPSSQIADFFEERHPGVYRVWNLCCERMYTARQAGLRCTIDHHFRWADHTPPPFPMIRPGMESMHRWLSRNPDNVAVVHCKAGKGRTGTFIAMYLIRNGGTQVADEALNIFGIRRTKNNKGVTIPSQKRYVRYYGLQYGALYHVLSSEWPSVSCLVPTGKSRQYLTMENSVLPSEKSEGYPAVGRVLPSDSYPFLDEMEVITIELHRDSKRDPGFTVGHDHLGRPIVTAIAKYDEIDSIVKKFERSTILGPSIEADSSSSIFAPIYSLIFPGDELIQVNGHVIQSLSTLGMDKSLDPMAMFTPDGGPKLLAPAKSAVTLLRSAPDPFVIVLARRIPANAVTPPHSHLERVQRPIPPVRGPRTAHEYWLRVAAAIGPWAWGSTPFDAPLPRIQITRLMLNKPLMLKELLREALDLNSKEATASSMSSSTWVGTSSQTAASSDRDTDPHSPGTSSPRYELSTMKDLPLSGFVIRTDPLYWVIRAGPGCTQTVYDSRRPMQSGGTLNDADFQFANPMPSAGHEKEKQIYSNSSQVAGDFRLLIFMTGKKKPLASIWLNTAFLPLPTSAQNVVNQIRPTLQQHSGNSRRATPTRLLGRNSSDPSESKNKETKPSLNSTGDVSVPGSTVFSVFNTSLEGQDDPDGTSDMENTSVVDQLEIELSSPTESRLPFPGNADLLDFSKSSPTEDPNRVGPSIDWDESATKYLGSDLGIGDVPGRASANLAFPGPLLGAIVTAWGIDFMGPTQNLFPQPVTQKERVGKLLLNKTQIDGAIKDKKDKVWPSDVELTIEFEVMDGTKNLLK